MKKVCPCLLVLAGVSLFLWNALCEIRSAGDTPIFNLINIDWYAWCLPYLTFAKTTILSGTFPLWTPYQAVGSPFFAIIGSNLLYPFTWIALVTEVPRALLIIQFLNISVAIVGMILYMRYLRMSWLGTIMASLLFGYCALEQSFLLCVGATYCWLPFVFLSTHRLVHKPTFQSSVLLTVSLSLCFLGGFVQYFYYICLLVFIYFLVILSFDRIAGHPGSSLRPLALFSLAFVLVTGIVSIQLIPTLELSQLSVRNLNDSIPDGYSMFSPVRWFGKYLGRDFSLNYFGSALFFAPFALGSRKNRSTVAALLVIAIYPIVFILAKQTPALAILGKIPFSDLFRAHLRMLNLEHFAIAALAGIGLSSISDMQDVKSATFRNHWFRIFLIISIFLIAYPLLGLRQMGELLQHSYSYALMFFPAFIAVSSYLLFRSNYAASRKKAISILAFILSLCVVIAHRDVLAPVAYLTFCLTGIVLAFIFFLEYAGLSSTKRKLGITFLAVLVFIDVMANRGPAEFTVPATAPPAFEIDDVAAWLKKTGGFDRAYLNSDYRNSYNLGTMYGILNINSYEMFTLARWRGFICFLAGQEQFDSEFPDGLFYGTLERLGDPLLVDPRALGLTSLKYIVTRERLQLNGSDEAWRLSYEDDALEPKFFIYENRYALPRAYLVDDYVLTQNENKTLHAIEENLSNLSSSVVLENAAPSFPPTTTGSHPGEVRITRYGVNVVELDVQALRDSLVVLTDAYYPGWKAYVDGEQRPIWRANSIFRSVEVPSGLHTLVFKFEPSSVRLGAAISLMTICVILSGLYFETNGFNLACRILNKKNTTSVE